MLNIGYIKDILIEDTDKLLSLLEATGFANIDANREKEIRCSRNEEGNKTAIKIYKDSLLYTDFVKATKGDIFTLIGENNNLNFPETLSLVCSTLHIDATNFEVKPKYQIFGGFYEGIKEESGEEQTVLSTYTDEDLKDYEKATNQRFLNDGISLSTQVEFGMRYDLDNYRIVIPWYSFDGEIIGAMGRYNGNDGDEKGIPKYIPTIAFPKLQSLYGYSQNRNEMFGKTIFIGEAEKFVLQLATVGIHNCVALGGNTLSRVRIKHLQMLYPTNIIMCYDEGLNMEVVEREVNSLIPEGFVDYKVGFVCDFNNKYMAKGSKCSASDMGLGTFKKIIKECTVWVH